MGAQRGSNEAGVNGILDITGSSKRFHVVASGFDKATMIERINRNGRGNAGYALSRVAFEIARITIYGDDNLDGFPEPTKVRDANGTLTIQMGTTPDGGTPLKVTYTVTMDASTYKYNAAKDDNWKHTIVCNVTGAPVYSGWSGTQPTTSPPSLSALELYLGTSKTYDSNFILTGATQSFDYPSVTDSDAAEGGILSTHIGNAVAPMTNLKIVTADFKRTDKDGGMLGVTWALNDSKDAIEKPGTHTDLDPLLIESTAKDTDVYLTAGGVPSAPTAPSAELQLTLTHIEEINPIVSKRIVGFEVLNSQQKRTFPKIQTTDDANNIADDAMRAEFWNVGDTPPALPSDAPANNVKLIDFTDVPITPTQNMRVWLYGPHDSRDKVVLPNYETVADASDLQSTAVRACLDGEAISDPAGYVLRSTKTHPITLSLGVNRTLTVKVYGLRTTAQDIENPGTFNDIEVDALASKGQVTTLYTTSGGVPSDPTPAANLKITNAKTQVVNSIKSVKVWELATRTFKGAHQYDNSEVSCGITNGGNWERITTIETCSAGDTIEDLAQAAHVALKGTTSPTQGVPYSNVRARRYHETAWIKTVTYEPTQFASLPPTDKIRISGSLTEIPVESWLGFNDAGNVSVYVHSSRSRGSGKYLIQLSPYRGRGIGGPLIIRQRISGTTPALGTTSIGKVNSAAFLGFSAGTVKYLGASYDVVISDTSSTYDMQYIFAVSMTTDCVAFPTLKGVPLGGAILADSTETESYATGGLAGSGGPTAYTWANLKLKATIPATDAFNFTTWTQ
jgi:hypothetical protein